MRAQTIQMFRLRNRRAELSLGPQLLCVSDVDMLVSSIIRIWEREHESYVCCHEAITN